MRVKLLIVFVFTVLLAFPQSNANTQLKDSLTYQAYLQKDWNKLIEIGKECINQGVQFEFLDLRMGIAYYEKKNYRKAIKYFENALADEVYPETTAEYLYYAYQYTGNDIEASKILFKVESEFSKSKRDTFRFLKNIYVFSSVRKYDELAYKSNVANINRAQILENKKHSYSTQYIPKNYINYHTGLSFRVLPYWSINLAYQNFQIEREQYFVDAFKDTSFTSHITQNQFYINNMIGLNSKLQLSVYASYLDNVSNFQIINTETFPPIYEEEIDHNSSNLLIGLGLKQNFNYFDLRLSSTYLKSKYNSFNQSDLGLDLYPFGNRKLSLKSEISILTKLSDSSHLIVSETLIYSPFERILLSATGRWGDMRNYATDQAYNVYNGIYKLDQVLQFNLTLRLFKTLYLKAYYELTSNSADIKSKDMTFENAETPSKTVEKINFNTHSFIGGLIWEF